MNLLKVLKTLRNLKIWANPSAKDKAESCLHPDNLIEVDSDDIIKGELGEDYNGMVMGHYNKTAESVLVPGEDLKSIIDEPSEASMVKDGLNLQDYQSGESIDGRNQFNILARDKTKDVIKLTSQSRNPKSIELT